MNNNNKQQNEKETLKQDKTYTAKKAKEKITELKQKIRPNKIRQQKAKKNLNHKWSKQKQLNKQIDTFIEPVFFSALKYHFLKILLLAMNIWYSI